MKLKKLELTIILAGIAGLTFFGLLAYNFFTSGGVDPANLSVQRDLDYLSQQVKGDLSNIEDHGFVEEKLQGWQGFIINLDRYETTSGNIAVESKLAAVIKFTNAEQATQFVELNTNNCSQKELTGGHRPGFFYDQLSAEFPINGERTTCKIEYHNGLSVDYFSTLSDGYVLVEKYI